MENKKIKQIITLCYYAERAPKEMTPAATQFIQQHLVQTKRQLLEELLFHDLDGEKEFELLEWCYAQPHLPEHLGPLLTNYRQSYWPIYALLEGIERFVRAQLLFPPVISTPFEPSVWAN
jgi:hypothetical protein